MKGTNRRHPSRPGSACLAKGEARCNSNETKIRYLSIDRKVPRFTVNYFQFHGQLGISVQIGNAPPEGRNHIASARPIPP